MMFLIKSKFIPCSHAASFYVIITIEQLKYNLVLGGQYFPTYSQIKCRQINTQQKCKPRLQY